MRRRTAWKQRRKDEGAPNKCPGVYHPGKKSRYILQMRKNTNSGQNKILKKN